jgi:tetratricopeptide (TPR) repeat protein
MHAIAWGALALLTATSSSAWAGWVPENKQVAGFNKAVTASEEDRFEDALAILDKAIAKQPSCGACRLFRGQLLLRLNQAEAAVEEGRWLVRKHGDQLGTHRLLSTAAFAAEQFDLALKEAAADVQRHPTDPDAWRNQINAARRTGDDALVDEATGRLAELTSPAAHACLTASIALERGRPSDAQRDAERCDDPNMQGALRRQIARALGEDGAAVGESVGEGGEWVDQIALAGDALVVGDAARALRLATAASEAQPQSPTARLLIGRAQLALGEEEAALDAFESVLGDTPRIDITRRGFFVGVTTKRGERIYLNEVSSGIVLYTELLARRGEEDRLQRGLDALETRWPELGAVEGAHALLVALRGDPKRAWRRLDEALARHPSDDSLAAFVGSLAVRDPGGLTPAARERLRQEGAAVSAYNAALQLHRDGHSGLCVEILGGIADNPSLTKPRNQLRVQCAQATGDARIAEQAIADAGGVGAVDPAARYNQALARVQAGDAEAAAAILEGFTPEDPSLALQAANLWALSLAKTGRLAEAHAAASAPGVHESTRYNIGLALRAAGDSAAALALLDAHPPTEPDIVPLAESERVRLLLDLDRLGEAQAAAAAAGVSEALRYNVALATFRAGDAETTLSLLATHEPTDPEVARQSRQLQAEALVAAGRLDDAASLARSGGLDATSRRNIAAAFVRAERLGPAARLAPKDTAGPHRGFWTQVRVLARVEAGELDAAFALTDHADTEPLLQVITADALLSEQDIQRALVLIDRACPRVDTADTKEWCQAMLHDLSQYR